MDADDERLIVPKPRVDDVDRQDKFPTWMWVAAAGAIVLAIAAVVILLSMGVHGSH